MKKYLDLASSETIVIQRGLKDTYVLSAQERIPDADLALAMSAEQLLAGIEEDIREAFSKRVAQ